MTVPLSGTHPGGPDERRRVRGMNERSRTGQQSARALLPVGLAFFGDRVRAVPPAAWSAATPCDQWSVRDLVNHLVAEHRWAADLLAGQTMSEVGDRYDGDVLGEDPVGAWRDAAAASAAAWARVSDDDARIGLSAGQVPLGEYAEQMLLDLAVHGWDLSRGAGLDERIPPELVRRVLRYTEPRVELFAGSGMFGAPVRVEDGDEQARLLGLLGRHP
jgi:uncharacterized protein (TIGR03086 family)